MCNSSSFLESIVANSTTPRVLDSEGVCGANVEVGVIACRNRDRRCDARHARVGNALGGEMQMRR